MNIVDPILFHCKSIPMAPAIAAPGQNMNLISYRRLGEAIINVGRKAVSFGLTRGNIVAVALDDVILNAAIILGLTRIGVITFQGAASNIPSGLKVDAAISDRLALPGARCNTRSSSPTATGWRATASRCPKTITRPTQTTCAGSS